jgi:integrase
LYFCRGELAEWSIAAVLKTVDCNRSGGSNPSLSAHNTKSPNKGLFCVNRLSGDTKGTRTKFRFMAKKYRWAKIYKGKTGSISDKWFVYYFFLSPFSYKFERIRVYEGINYIDDLKEKEKFAQELAEEVNAALKAGYDPFLVSSETNQLIIDKEFEVQKDIKLNNDRAPRLLEALKIFLNNKKQKDLSKDTLTTYGSYISKFEDYLFESKNADIYIDELTIAFIEEMLTFMHDKLKWNGTTYNNHLNFWVTLINWFSKKPRYWIKKEDFDIGIEKDLEPKSSKPMKHQYYGDQVGAKVKESLKDHPKLDFYCRFIYFSCMRPEEIRNLQIENVDLKGRYIKIVGKTSSRAIPICDELAVMLQSLNLEDFKLNYYVLGKNGEVSPIQHSENYYSRRFRVDIKRALGISDNFTCYGWKHTRVVDLLNNGYSDAEIMNLTGHRDTESYDTYKRELISHIKTRLRGETIGW